MAHRRPLPLLMMFLMVAALLPGCQSGTQPEPAAPDEPTPEPSATPTLAVPMEVDGERALALAQSQCDIGPRPAGSEALIETRDWIVEELESHGWRVEIMESEFQGVPIYNVLAARGDSGPARMLGAHYDTRPVADEDPENPDQPIIGGNDGASGVAVLLELARTLEPPEDVEVQLAFFDAEDRGRLDGWPFSVGAEQMVANWEGVPFEWPEAMVLLDMVGDADLQIYRERNSTPALNDTLFGIAGELGYLGDGFYDEEKWSIIDDHLPFLEAGVPAADLIDFDYPYWHTVEDTCDKLSAESLEKVGRVVEVWIEEWR